MKVTVGQTVWLNPTNNAKRMNWGITSGTVVKVGRKYATVKPEQWGSARVFCLEDGTEKSEFSSSWIMYESVQAIHDEEEAEEIHKELCRVFNGFGRPRMSVAALREIKQIVLRERARGE